MTAVITRARAVVSMVALGLALSACTSSGGTRPPSSAPASSSAPSRSSASAAPIVATAADSCPYIATDTVSQTIGMRLGRITLLHSGGALVGCRIYAVQGSSYTGSEHLPGPNQPALEILLTRHATATDAHNAFILAQRAGTQPYTVSIAEGVPGVVYRTEFDPGDHPSDWAVGFSAGTTQVLVRGAVNDQYLKVLPLARIVYTKL